MAAKGIEIDVKAIVRMLVRAAGDGTTTESWWKDKREALARIDLDVDRPLRIYASPRTRLRRRAYRDWCTVPLALPDAH